jgi:hypothetical protein
MIECTLWMMNIRLSRAYNNLNHLPWSGRSPHKPNKSSLQGTTFVTTVASSIMKALCILALIPLLTESLCIPAFTTSRSVQHCRRRAHKWHLYGAREDEIRRKVRLL